MTRDQILGALQAFAEQRPGLEFGNYGDVTAYRAEMRSITRDLHHARTLLSAVRWRASIDVGQLREAFRAYSGRLSIHEKPDGGCDLSYTTGQYFPTEYRRAVCAVLASALWDYTRDCMPEPEYVQHGSADDLPMRTEAVYRLNGRKVSGGDWIRTTLRKEFGRSIACRWFS